MMNRISRKILAWVLGISLIVGLIPLSTIMADDNSTSGKGTVTYSAEWISSSEVEFRISPTVDGTAYYSVSGQEIASDADLEASDADLKASSADLDSLGKAVKCPAGKTTTVRITADSKEECEINVTFIDDNGNNYGSETLTLLANSEPMLSASTTDSEATVEAERISKTSMTMTFTADVSGTFYYILQDVGIESV